MRTQTIFRTLLIAAALSLGGGTTGCIAVGEGDKSFYTQPTLGKQLQDLKQAHDTGAMTDAEYADAKSKIVNGEVPKKN